MQPVAQRIVITFVLACAYAVGPAQAFPNGPINIVVPLAPGDAADISVRLLGEEMAKSLSTPVVVTNRPGAGGALGTNTVVQSKKDGQTILFAPNSALTFRPVIEPQAVSYDTARDLLPLGISSRTPSMLVVRSDAVYGTLAELIEHAKKEPGSVRIGHPGAGSVGDFCIQLINALTGAQLLAVPYAGAAPAVTALRGGHIEGVVLALGALSAHIKAGALRAIVTSSRAPELAEVRTMRELGYAEDLFGVWFSFLAPAGIPEDARKALVGAIEQAVKAPTIAARLAPLGIGQSYASPDQQSTEMREELKRVSDLAKRTGLVK
ncbi:MAG: tripartite tricarboxylate transporter substrate binding protein [Burkholderiaceae bacterium]